MARGPSFEDGLSLSTPGAFSDVLTVSQHLPRAQVPQSQRLSLQAQSRPNHHQKDAQTQDDLCLSDSYALLYSRQLKGWLQFQAHGGHDQLNLPVRVFHPVELLATARGCSHGLLCRAEPSELGQYLRLQVLQQGVLLLKGMMPVSNPKHLLLRCHCQAKLSCR